MNELYHYGRSKKDGAPVGSGRYPLGSGIKAKREADYLVGIHEKIDKMMPKWEEERLRYNTLVQVGYAALNQTDKEYETVVNNARDLGIDIGDRKNLHWLFREELPTKITSLKYMKQFEKEGEKFVQDEITNIHKTRIRNIIKGVDIGVSLLPIAGAAAVAVSPALQEQLTEKIVTAVQKISNTDAFKKVQETVMPKVFEQATKLITPDTIKAVNSLISSDLIEQVQSNMTPELMSQIQKSITPEMIEQTKKYISKKK